MLQPQNSIQAHFGIGVAYNVTPYCAITAECDFSCVQKYGSENDHPTSSVQLWLLGLRYAL